MDGLITLIRCFSLSAKVYSYGDSLLIARYWRKSKSLIRYKRRLPQGETCFSTEFAPLLLRTGSDSLKAPITQVAPLATSRLTAAIAVTVLTGWIAQIDLLKNFAPGMIAMNPFTAGGLLAASAALFLRQPIDAPKKRSIIGQLLAGADRGTLAIIVSETAAGMLARRLIPLAILLPILIGALRQTAERAGLYDPTFGAAHSATTFMVLFFAAIWWTTRMLFRIDTNRMLAEGARQKQEEQVRQLNIEKIAAERASKAKDDFLAVLSHELRTPLTPALAAASYLAEHEDLSPQLREEVTAIRTSVQLDARLIDDLLDLTRITRGKIELHLEVVDVHGLLRNSLEIARDNILEKQLDLIVNFGADRHHVWADAVRLQQVFWNLLNNAVKFSRKSGRITMRTANEDRRFVFQITDTGVGIEPEELGRK